MKISRFLINFSIDSVNLSIKAKLLALIGCFCAIFFIALITKIVSPCPNYPMIVASMGASAIILFFIPSSPLAQPWPFVGGQLVSAIVIMTCALNIPETFTAAAYAVGGSIVMMLLYFLHPPAAATSLTPIMKGSSIASLGCPFVLVPVAIDVVTLLFLATSKRCQALFFAKLYKIREYKEGREIFM